MSDSVTTKLDVPYGQQPETRAAAVRVLERLGAIDLIEMLGLGDVPESTEPAGDRPLCRNCNRPVALDGRCRRSSCYPGVLARKAGETA